MARVAGQRNVSNGILFDTLDNTGAANTTTKYTLFQQTRSVGLWKTNMKIAGMLPAPESFTVRSIRFGVYPSGSAIGTAFSAIPLLTDCLEMLHTGVLYLEVGSKPYVDYWPLWMFSLGFTQAAIGENTDAAAVGVVLGNGDPSTVIQLRHPIKINTNEPFRVEVQYGIAPTPSAALSCQVVLGGDYVRAVE